MRQQEKMQYWENNGMYADGNTARDLQALERKEQIHREFVQKQEKEREQKMRQRQTRAAVQRNKARALQISPGYVLFLAAIVVVMAGVFACYLQLQSELNQNVQNVASLEAQVLELKNDNDAQQKKINNSVNMDEIRQYAMDVLGMVYPQEDQIKYFESDSDDYMNQYEAIPER